MSAHLHVRQRKLVEASGVNGAAQRALRWLRLATARLLASVLAVGTPVLAQAPEPDTVQGTVVDAEGRPVEGAEVTARYQSNPGGVSYSRSTHTDARGRYRIDVAQPPGVWTIHASTRIAIGGGSERMVLTPDDDAPFAGSDGAIRNFRQSFDVPTADAPSGSGGMLVVAAAIGDYTPLDEVTVVLTPVAGGASIERRLEPAGDGHVVTGLVPQPYRVQAFRGDAPLLISTPPTPSRDYDWREALTGDFERTGPGIFQLRVEVRSR